ncbi:hypothetical protein JOD43_003498 [Pullulanibacillus pueri]|nr:hypothetical protein [Pullulanibacillus pueri]
MAVWLGWWSIDRRPDHTATKRKRGSLNKFKEKGLSFCIVVFADKTYKRESPYERKYYKTAYCLH